MVIALIYKARGLLPSSRGYKRPHPPPVPHALSLFKSCGNEPPPHIHLPHRLGPAVHTAAYLRLAHIHIDVRDARLNGACYGASQQEGAQAFKYHSQLRT